MAIFNSYVKLPEGIYPGTSAPGQGCIAPMRWNHLGVLCWARSALPFLAAVLRSLLRDETYEVNAVRSQRVPLRVRRTADLETLMNVALWKAGAYKQLGSGLSGMS